MKRDTVSTTVAVATVDRPRPLQPIVFVLLGGKISRDVEHRHVSIHRGQHAFRLRVEGLKTRIHVCDRCLCTRQAVDLRVCQRHARVELRTPCLQCLKPPRLESYTPLRCGSAQQPARPGASPPP
eukprot:CAMPEP_0180242060 /NCGR_PEP_ID=MMETSP0987-20121128/33004_1 /TAXON_ID=697907 /ORGANISM="non described non described, Strain CCMP2293" /LENGTH=124 /DNA_ID=CAMNT_0022209113 /DNA_START=79 /DNA_END=450 /DNA_ORIENTATION=+